ncbi:riboflavin-specific deaminase C-terminal domain-containing protein [Flavobacterium sp. CF108]|uniref:RibD family protein n=1 Tax=unclassified Flavobacterium TaxID=196869 RepID=UPI0008AAB007|nr:MULTISPECIES: RibD family protein [unclassified Flavobacterium]SEP24473.1 riboflavin-specific deaminase C-terminal domain-containing protein [Flavobacterium sp. fv08]SHI01828.1 riboflavin-specific deaminase C-terminal domain-containing protein [Flavobacterium sp. CF108]
MKVKPAYWDLLLNIKETYQSIDVSTETLSITYEYNVIKSTGSSLSEYLAVICFYPDKEKEAFFEVLYGKTFPKQLKNVFNLYLGYILVNKHSKIPFTCVHVAQTIDGKIATVTRKSKWIGNQENLIHNHRIRALVDAILIGGNTFRIDRPKLDVRHVKGKNPIKAIIANSPLELEDLTPGKTYLFSCKNLSYNHMPPDVEVVNINDGTECIPIKSLLEVLKQNGVHSVLVEGGALTIRRFIEHKMLSRIEFHIAPMLFGSGKNGIELQEIQDLNEAICLNNPKYYNIGNAIMIVSNL